MLEVHKNGGAKMSGKVFSYLRFSTPKQAAGASKVRQLDYAKNWAADNNMLLDDALSMRDEGLSAFHQKHVKNGALGVFLEAVSAGKIPTGSVLIVEGLDRLSRAEPILAQAQLAQIINAGITVVTAVDNKAYNRESLKSNPMDLVYSLLVMIRAHEESATKSKRVADQLRRKCEGWVAGTYRGKISCGANPSWVTWTGEKFELTPGISDAVRLVVRRFTEGLGAVKIIAELKAAGVEVTGMRQANNINQLVCAQPHLFIGDRKVVASGQEYLLKGYYPPLLSPDEYARLLLAIEHRRENPRAVVGKATFTSILTGGGITTCGHCGAAIIARNQRRNPTKGGALFNRRMVCPRCEVARKGNAGCATEILERAVFDFCSDQMNLDSLSQTGQVEVDARTVERAELTQRIAENEKRAAKFMDAALSDDTALPQMLIQRLRDMETQIAADKARLAVLAAAMTVRDTEAPPNAEKWLELRRGVLGLDVVARRSARQLVLETFSHIQVYNRGAFTDSPKGIVDILLVAKSGVSRHLRVDRKTGDLVRGTERRF